MARYTLNLSELVSTISDQDTSNMTGVSFDYIDNMIENAIPRLFSNQIPILDNAEERKKLCKKIIEHYWEYEICTYTPNDFIFRLNRKLNEIMPYYNQLFQSTLIKLDPYNDVDYTVNGVTQDINKTIDDNTTMYTGQDVSTLARTGNDTVDGTLDTDTTEKSDGNWHGDKNVADVENGKNAEHTSIDVNDFLKSSEWEYRNDTPQGKISGVDDLDYLTSYSKKEPKNEVSGQNGWIGDDEATAKHKIPANPRKLNESDLSRHIDVSNETANHTTNESFSNYGEKRDGSGTVDTTTQDKTTYNSTFKTTLDKGTMDKTDNVRDFKHDGTDDKHYKGKMSTDSYSKRMLEFRETMLNIDQMVLDELKELFFIIY